MPRLPNVNDLVAQIATKAQQAETEKVAAENAPVELTVPVAQEIQKLAQSLRDAGNTRLDYADVQAFANRMKGVS